MNKQELIDLLGDLYFHDITLTEAIVKLESEMVPTDDDPPDYCIYIEPIQKGEPD